MPAKEVESLQNHNGRLGTLLDAPKLQPADMIFTESSVVPVKEQTTQPPAGTSVNTPQEKQSPDSTTNTGKPEAKAERKHSQKASSEKGVKPGSAKPKNEAASASLPKTNQFLQSMAKQLRGQQTMSSDPAQFEIKIGREIAYRGKEGQAAEVNKIDPQTLAYLKAAIKLPQADPKQPQPEKSLNRAITIKVNNEVVFRLSKGVVETNKLDPALKQQITQAATPEENQAPAGVTPQQQVATTETQPSKEQPTLLPDSSSSTNKTVPALEIVEQQIQQQPEGTVRQYLGQAVQALKLASKLASAKAQQQFKQLPQQAQNATTKVQQQIKDLPHQAIKLPQTLRDRQTAETALKLLNHYGTRDGVGKSYQAANYTICTTGKDSYGISDSRGKELMKFKQTFLGPQVESNQMSRHQMQDFDYARSQIQLKGGVEVLAADPAMRIRQLGNLAPAEVVAKAQAAKHIAAAAIAKNVLQVLGSNRYENDQYQFQRQGDNLRISAKDGRGEILSLKDGQLAGNLKPLDVSNLKQLDQQVSREVAHQSLPQETSREQQIAI